MAANDMSPHAAVIWLQYEIHELLPSGECSGKAVKREKKTIQIKGFDRHDCEKKLSEAIDRLQAQ